MAKECIRSCVGCRRKSAKPEFLRIVKAKDDSVFIDVSGKAPGRGAYLCHNVDCLKKALKGNRLVRALRAAGQLSQLNEELIVTLMNTDNLKAQ